MDSRNWLKLRLDLCREASDIWVCLNVFKNWYCGLSSCDFTRTFRDALGDLVKSEKFWFFFSSLICAVIYWARNSIGLLCLVSRAGKGRVPLLPLNVASFSQSLSHMSSVSATTGTFLSSIGRKSCGLLLTLWSYKRRFNFSGCTCCQGFILGHSSPFALILSGLASGRSE